jgi:hypothetical protein
MCAPLNHAHRSALIHRFACSLLFCLFQYLPSLPSVAFFFFPSDSSNPFPLKVSLSLLQPFSLFLIENQPSLLMRPSHPRMCVMYSFHSSPCDGSRARAGSWTRRTARFCFTQWLSAQICLLCAWQQRSPSRSAAASTQRNVRCCSWCKHSSVLGRRCRCGCGRCGSRGCTADRR